MPFPETPIYKQAHGVIAVDQPLPRRPGVDEALIAALAQEFPIVGPRQLLTPDTPPNLPHLILQSTSSQVAISSTQIDFEVRFYGEYADSPDLSHEYIHRKMSALLQGWLSIGAEPVLAGDVLTIGFSFQHETDVDPVSLMFERHVRSEVPTDSVSDVRIQFGLRVRDHFFVSLGLATYEARQLLRPLMPGQQALVVRPWEGRIVDSGLDLTIDVNNRLRALRQEQYEILDQAELDRVLDLSRQLAETCAVPFARDGNLDLEHINELVI